MSAVSRPKMKKGDEIALNVIVVAGIFTIFLLFSGVALLVIQLMDGFQCIQ